MVNTANYFAKVHKKRLKKYDRQKKRSIAKKRPIDFCKYL